MPSILVFVLFFAGVYFLLLRPQQQRVRRQRQLINAVGVGDRVVTAGGLIGRVVDVTDDRLHVEIADGVVVELLRLAISRRLDEAEPGAEAAEAYEGEYEGAYEEESDDGEGESAAREEIDGEAAPHKSPGAAAVTDFGIEEGVAGVAPPDAPSDEAAKPVPGQDTH
jgi:preprotein translocase subunit YajC